MKTFTLNNKTFTIREFDAEKDSVKKLTELLHRAYKRLADMGLNFVATYQDVESTKALLKRGICFILTEKDKLIGTIFYHTDRHNNSPEIYNDKDVVLFGKFAVEPVYQNLGLGSMLMDFIEDYARSDGKKQIILDTSEKARHLIDYYTKRGYKYIQHWTWDVVNYKSVVMGKKL